MKFRWNLAKFERNLAKFCENSVKICRNFGKFLLKFWVQSGAKGWKSCRSRKIWKNAPTLAIVAVDTAENEPLKFWGWFHSCFIRLLKAACHPRLKILPVQIFPFAYLWGVPICGARMADEYDGGEIVDDDSLVPSYPERRWNDHLNNLASSAASTAAWRWCIRTVFCSWLLQPLSEKSFRKFCSIPTFERSPRKRQALKLLRTDCTTGSLRRGGTTVQMPKSPVASQPAVFPVLIICNPGRSGGGRGSRIYRDTEIPQKIATFSQLFLKLSRLFSNFCSIPAITYIFPPSRRKSANFSTKNHRFAERSAKSCKNPKFFTKFEEFTRKSAKFWKCSWIIV